jgi:two-component system, NarL family, response regulator NreC
MIQASDPSLATIRLAIVTRHCLDGDALAALFSTRTDFFVVCTTTSLTVASLVNRHRRPDVVILDGTLVNSEQIVGDVQLQGLDAALSKLAPTPVLVLEENLHSGHFASTRQLQNVGYCFRSAPFADLAESVVRLAIEKRRNGYSTGSSAQNAPHAWQPRTEPADSDLGLLTPREMEVLKLIAQGNTVKHCAELLALAPSTVDNHKSRLMKKLGVHKSLELTRLAIRAGLVSL